MTNKEIIALYITLNIWFIMFYVIRSLIWVFKYKNQQHRSCSLSYINYTFFDDSNNIGAITCIFCTINAFAIIVSMCIKIESML